MARVLFVVTEDWYFLSHRLHIAQAAKRAGFEVAVATYVERGESAIRGAGLELFSLRYMDRRGIRPFREWQAVRELVAIYRDWRPDIVHHVALKPIVLGSIAATMTNVPHVVQALAGMGFVFSSASPKARLLRIPMCKALSWALSMDRAHVIVQNRDDWQDAVKLGAAEDRMHWIPGSGVDLRRFSPESEPDGVPVVTMVARMLKEKGVEEFVQAVRLLRARGIQVRGWLVGEPDVDNPSAIAGARLRQWAREGVIEYHGRRDDIPNVWAASTIAVLPSYREGLPKSLLEAAACGRAMVATDVPGCREIVQHERTGLLVPPRDPEALADAIARLLQDAALRRKLARNARKLVEERFSNERIAEQTLCLYRKLLA